MPNEAEIYADYMTGVRMRLDEIGRIEYSGEDDRRFRPNVTGDSARSALLRFFTLVGHDQSTFGCCRAFLRWTGWASFS